MKIANYLYRAFHALIILKLTFIHAAENNSLPSFNPNLLQVPLSSFYSHREQGMSILQGQPYVLNPCYRMPAFISYPSYLYNQVPPHPSMFPFAFTQPMPLSHQNLPSGSIFNSFSFAQQPPSMSSSSSSFATSVEETSEEDRRRIAKKRELATDDLIMSQAKRPKIQKEKQTYPNQLISAVLKILKDEKFKNNVPNAFQELAREFKYRDLDAGIADLKRKNCLPITELYFLNLLHKKVKQEKKLDDAKHPTPYKRELAKRIQLLSSKNPTYEEIVSWLQSEKQKLLGEESFFALYKSLPASSDPFKEKLKEVTWMLYLDNEYIEYLTSEDIDLLYKVYKTNGVSAATSENFKKEDLKQLLEKTILTDEQRLILQAAITRLDVNGQIH